MSYDIVELGNRIFLLGMCIAWIKSLRLIVKKYFFLKCVRTQCLMRPFDFPDTIKANPVLAGCMGGALG